MIELVSETRCISCSLCISVCPTNVFDKGDNGVPVIARKSDCQTCFMCEVYCPADALYVATQPDQDVTVSEEALAESGQLGSYRKTIGWGKGRTPIASSPQIYELSKQMLPDRK
ncbi:4Fe-4S binding protein [Paenibacillus sp. S150]|uniref:4Fe-4S binding protein n=1 Tax=Paenibacillus sp. S150 TaxID=2749826 RepID=UPI001C581FF8|nr:4Fe-4S binding protein [Paenibacillus sp. S150]MBW4079823.1 ferredoxin family protein [Paenibacillus sp. S150]